MCRISVGLSVCRPHASYIMLPIPGYKGPEINKDCPVRPINILLKPLYDGTTGQPFS